MTPLIHIREHTQEMKTRGVSRLIIMERPGHGFFPLFARRGLMCTDTKVKDTALSLLSSAVELINYGCTGHIPEILDGDYPHKARGCDAQAWGASEALRVRTKLLQSKKNTLILFSRNL